MRTIGRMVDSGHRRSCGVCRGRARPSDAGPVAAQSCCTLGTLTLTRNWALPGARQRTLARDVGEGSGDVLCVQCESARDGDSPDRR